MHDLRIAVLDTRLLADADDHFIHCLSDAELQRYRSFTSARRKREWLGARLAAKVLFLRRMESPRSKAHGSHVVDQISRETLVSLPLWMYRNVEVMTGRDLDQHCPRFRWRGCESAAAVSLSHTGHNACACIAGEGDIGIDLQKVGPRVGAFYRSNYAAVEQRWVDRGASLEPASRDWLYTLLWTLKEAALKAKALVHTSPVSFSGIDVVELPPPETILRAYRQDDGSRLMRLTARIREDRNIRSLQVAVTGTKQMILTVVKPSRSLAKK